MSLRALRRGTMAGRGAAAPFGPQAIVGAVGVWVADDLALADAAAVSAWPDRIAALSLAQGTAGSQPVYDLDGIGGQPSVNFDGTADLLRYAGALSTALSGHVFLVCQPTSMVGSDFMSTFDEASTNRGLDFNQTLDTIRIMQIDNDTQDRVIATTSTLTAGNNYLLEWASSGTVYSLRINNTVQGLSVTAGSNTGDWFGDTTLRDSFIVGGRKTTTEGIWCPERVGAVVVVDGAISAGDRTALNTWVAAKYGITLA